MYSPLVTITHVSCKACKYGQKKKTFTSTVTKKEFKINQCINCKTENVIYCIQCPCGLQYIGKTNRKLSDRIREHIRNIEKGLDTHSLSKHFELHHGKNPKGLKYWGIEITNKKWRGGDLINHTLRIESKWIYTLQTLEPKGLNIDFNLKAFL